MSISGSRRLSSQVVSPNLIYQNPETKHRVKLSTYRVAIPTKPADYGASASDFSFLPSVDASTACPLYRKQYPAVEQSTPVGALQRWVSIQLDRPRHIL